MQARFADLSPLAATPAAAAFRSGPMHSPRAFTLIELLIVVAIIAILAAIAVPNFLEAQTRAKVARAKADIKTLVTGIESHRVDERKLINAEDYTGRNTTGVVTSPSALTKITTPIAYLSSLPPLSHFGPWQSPNWQTTWYANGYMYVGGTVMTAYAAILMPLHARKAEYTLVCMGPTQKYSSAMGAGYIIPYDPSNGTVSIGDIIYAAGSARGWGSFK